MKWKPSPLYVIVLDLTCFITQFSFVFDWKIWNRSTNSRQKEILRSTLNEFSSHVKTRVDFDKPNYFYEIIAATDYIIVLYVTRVLVFWQGHFNHYHPFYINIFILFWPLVRGQARKVIRSVCIAEHVLVEKKKTQRKERNRTLPKQLFAKQDSVHFLRCCFDAGSVIFAGEEFKLESKYKKECYPFIGSSHVVQHFTF